jgi:hypothetical protein
MKYVNHHTLKIAYLLSVIAFSALLTVYGLIAWRNETGTAKAAVESLQE